MIACIVSIRTRTYGVRRSLYKKLNWYKEANCNVKTKTIQIIPTGKCFIYIILIKKLLGQLYGITVFWNL